MRIRNIIAVLPELALLCACQSEVPQIDNTQKRVITVRASLPGSDNTRSWITYGFSDDTTRAQITYGNPDPNQEIFMWDEKGYGGLSNSDWIALYNVTRLSSCPIDGIKLEIKHKEGRSAIFESVQEVNPTIEIKKGDLIFVNYWETLIVEKEDHSSYDDRNIFKIGLDSSPQLIFNNPNDESLSYMQSNLKMYDVLTVEEDDSIPDIHFKHLSAIMRITLRNETGEYFPPKELQFNYSGTKSFFTSSIYCSADTESEDGSKLKIYPDFDGASTFSDIISSSINNYTAAEEAEKGDSIAPGKSYELYLSCVPRIANKTKGEKLIITLQKRLNSEESKAYSMTLDDFNVPIEAGKRYWFNLTAVDDEDGTGKLMLTSDWLKQQEQNQGNEDQNSSGD